MLGHLSYYLRVCFLTLSSTAARGGSKSSQK
nr:MAG TPA: hypothetical protein [Caudoviricetes sp.]